MIARTLARTGTTLVAALVLVISSTSCSGSSRSAPPTPSVAAGEPSAHDAPR
jgi:hypothetical protein